MRSNRRRNSDRFSPFLRQRNVRLILREHVLKDQGNGHRPRVLRALTRDSPCVGPSSAQDLSVLTRQDASPFNHNGIRLQVRSVSHPLRVATVLGVGDLRQGGQGLMFRLPTRRKVAPNRRRVPLEDMLR